MRADAESSCTASCTDSWSQDGARNPWSAPTTALWAPTGSYVMHSGPAVFDLLRHPAILDVVESVIGPEIASNPVQ